MRNAVPPIRIEDDLGLVKRRTQNFRVANLAAQPAADAAVVDMRDRIDLQRIGIGPDRQRRATREADAGMVAGAGVGVHAEAPAEPRP